MGKLKPRRPLFFLLEEIEQTRHIDDIKEQTTLDFQKGVFIKNVSFQNVEEYVLADENMEIPKSHSIALIGPSGAGKTTLADLLLGVLEPESGQIIADETDIRKEMSSWHNRIGYIPQTIY